MRTVTRYSLNIGLTAGYLSVLCCKAGGASIDLTAGVPYKWTYLHTILEVTCFLILKSDIAVTAHMNLKCHR